MPQIRMLENVWQGSTLLAAGSDVTVTTELADQLVGAGKAIDTTGYKSALVDQTMTDDVQRATALAVVGAAGVVSIVPADLLANPSTTTTGDGISAFTPYQIAAPGTYRRVRIYWRNISASAGRVLYIAANAPNATRGLKQSQDSKRRDASMVFGDHLMLISAEPITSLVFSSDGSISVNTHNLMISWGN